MTCTWCDDTKLMSWDSEERGVPPPPLGHSPEEEWTISEAFMAYSPEGEGLKGFFESLGPKGKPFDMVIPCPVCIGFGFASSSPWKPENLLSMKGVPEQFRESGSPEATWNRFYANALSLKESLAGIAVDKAKTYLALTRQQHLRSKLARNELRNAQEPNWPLWPLDDSYSCCPICQSGNFAPTVHPRTRLKAIGCCECGGAWILKEQPVENDADRERKKREIASLLYSLREAYLFSPGESEMLLARYGFDLVEQVARL